MKVDVFIGPEAEKLLGDPEFCQNWRELLVICPWASVFQEVEFVSTWYSTYKNHYTPVIVSGFDDGGKIAGLFTLAIENTSGKLVVAGDRYTEYGGWLADPKTGDGFIESAIAELREKFPNRILTLLFAHPLLPIKWIKPGNRYSGNCHLSTISRGLMAVGDGSTFKESLRKRNQNKINRLKRIGQVQFARIKDPEELRQVIDEIFCYQALRLRAVYNITNPENDQLRKTFFLNLMRLPGMLHVTVLRVGDNLVSGQIHMHNRDQVLLGLITHSPIYAKYSPGTLHLLMLGAELANDGIPTFDLTPGGDYKERYATDHDNAYILRIFFNSAQCLRYKALRKLRRSVKLMVEQLNILPAVLEAYAALLDQREKFSYLKTASLIPEVCRTLKRSLWHSEASSIYICHLEQMDFSPHEVNLPMNKNHIPDLLAYRPLEAWHPPINRFLKQAMQNLENGHHVYTKVENEMLLHFIWLTILQNSTPCGEDEWYAKLPVESAVISDYMFRPDEPLTRASLCQVLIDASRIKGVKSAYIRVSSDNLPLKRAVEELGFTCSHRHVRRQVLGRVIYG
ncbi:MAG: GNAT family N-acetyltransferase [Blastocatellia bacterium]|nr:GNAT family N-acetyltransferase [Blastocatellia bacterium]